MVGSFARAITSSRRRSRGATRPGSGSARRTIVSPTGVTFEAYADRWLDGARSGINLTRDLNPYKPSTVRAYAKHIRRVYPMVGSMRLTDVDVPALQDAANQLTASGLTASSVRNSFDPVRKIFARAVKERLIAVNPCAGLELKAADGSRDWVDSPQRVARALAVLSRRERGPWTVAFYAGLRCGEIQALRWHDIDFDRGVIRVERSWDRKAGPIAPKSKAGFRKVPMSMLIRRELRELQQQDISRRGDDLVFGRTADQAFAPQTLHRRTKAAWLEAGMIAEWAAEGMDVPGLHDARHHCLTHWGRVWDVGRLREAAGHSDIRQSQRYLHVPPDRDAEDAARLDAYLRAM